MRISLRRTAALALASATIAAGSSVLAQAPRRWVDPPAGPDRSVEPALPAPGPDSPPAPPTDRPEGPRAEGDPGPTAVRPAIPPSPDPSGRAAPPTDAPERQAAPRAQTPPPVSSVERPAHEDRLAAREEAARALVVDYLDLWSTPNPLALAGNREFYGPNVIFHGRAMSARALMEEKRRFVQRWPERRYRARAETIGVACGAGAETCTVRAVFDFLAADPARGRRSQGVGTLELVVSYGPDGRPAILAENSIVHGRGRARASAGTGDDDDVP